MAGTASLGGRAGKAAAWRRHASFISQGLHPSNRDREVLEEVKPLRLAPPPPAKAATPPPPLPTAAPVAAHGIAAAEELDSLDRELRDMGEPRPDEHF